MLYKWDYLEIMDQLIAQWIKVDAIITDPPYWTTACKWDTIIPFDKMWERLNKLIKPNWAIVLFGNEPFSSILRMSNIEQYKYDWIWVKSRKNGFVHAKGMPLRQTESVHIFSEGSIRRDSNIPMKYNPQGVEDVIIDRVNYVKTTATNSGGNKVGTSYKQKGVGYPVNLIQFKGVGTKQQVHPTQKPVALIEYLIKTYTNEWETVLDFTMWSGTTWVACHNLNRNFIWIELDDKYFEIAEQRILSTNQ